MHTLIEEIPTDAELLAVSLQAHARHLHLVTDGQRTFLTPIMLPGYQKMAVTIKPQEQVAA